MDRKENRWSMYKKECEDRMLELSEYFSGEKTFSSCKKKNESLQKWFKGLGNQIQEMDIKSNSTVTGRKIMHLMQALIKLIHHSK